MPDKAVIETIETQAHRIIIKGDGIIRIYSKPSHIEYGDIKALFDCFEEIRKDGGKLAVIIDPTQENSMTNEARNLIIEGMRNHMYCVVIVARKKFIRVLFGIISSVKNLGVQTKMVASEEEGVKWIISKYPTLEGK